MAYGTPFRAAAHGGNPPMMEEDRGVLIPAVNYDKVNHDVKIPRNCKTAMGWGRTLIPLPKWKSFRMTYGGLVNQALSGDDAACHYLEWLTRTYGPRYLAGPVKSQGTSMWSFRLGVWMASF